MAKTTLILLAALSISGLLYGLEAPAAAVNITPLAGTVSASRTAAPAAAPRAAGVSPTAVDIASHANGISSAAAAAYDAGSVTATVINEDDIMNIKVRELHLNITPEFKFVVPDADVFLGLTQKIGDTTLEGETEYNYIYNKIHYLLKYTLDLYVPVGVSLYDNIDFQQVYFEQKYIQRTKGLGVNAGSPAILSGFKFGEEFKNESSYLAQLDNGLAISNGLASIFRTWFEVKVTGNVAGKEFNKLLIGLDFEKAVPHTYSTYNFLFMNSSFTSNVRFNEYDNLMFHAETGHLLVPTDVPLWKVYNLGGFDSLIGYGLNEFQDYFKVAGRIKYEKQIADSLNWDLPLIRLDRIKGFAIVDCGISGDVHIIQDFNRYKFGTGAGLTFDFTFRKRTPIRATLALGQAIRKGPPVVYFIYELL
jgi:hypothetical protein